METALLETVQCSYTTESRQVFSGKSMVYILAVWLMIQTQNNDFQEYPLRAIQGDQKQNHQYPNIFFDALHIISPQTYFSAFLLISIFVSVYF